MRVAVLRPPLQGAEDQHVEGAVQQVGARVGPGGVQGHGYRESIALRRRESIACSAPYTGGWPVRVSVRSREFVEQLLDVTHDGISHRRIALVVGHV